MIFPSEAQKLILDRTYALPPVKVQLREALNLILAEPIIPMDDSPPFDNSAKDGYAVIARDIASASRKEPVRLQINERIPAGTRPTRRVLPGTASKIMTGAPMPEGADAVVMVEETRPDENQVLIFKPVAPGEEVRRAGEDLSRDSQVLAPGTRLNPARLALAAAAGYAQVHIHPKPRVGIIVTGGELVEPGEPLPPGKIRNSNQYALYGQVIEAGAIPVEYGIIGDDKKNLEEAISIAAAQCDVVVTTGGVSMGDFDFVIESAKEAGFSILFSEVAQRPGKPMVGGFKDEVLFFGLPGNPVSVMVCFEVYVYPVLQRLLGHEQIFRPHIAGTFEKPFSKVKGLQFWTRVTFEQKGDGFLLQLAANQRSDILSSMAFGNGLAEIPAEVETLESDVPVKVHLFSYGSPFLYRRKESK